MNRLAPWLSLALLILVACDGPGTPPRASDDGPAIAGAAAEGRTAP